jgi:hypothetical protein
MAQAGSIYFVQTNPQTQFTGACVQNAGLTEDFTLPMSIAAGGAGRCRIRSLTIYSVQNLAWEVQIYGQGVPGGYAQGTGPGSTAFESYLGGFAFQTANATQGPAPTGNGAASGNAVAGNYFYYVDGLDIDYEDRAASPVTTLGNFGALGTVGGAVGQGLIHVALVNRSATAKIIAGPGAIVVRIGCEPTLGWA